jgi:hypothetical protein
LTAFLHRLERRITMKRHLLRRFGNRQPWPRASASRRRPALEPLEARNLLDGGLANVLVNNPATDTSAQDTQSETAIVLGAGSKIVVAYNDTGLTSAAFPGWAGFSMSANGGATFADQGSLNHSLADPVLARSSKTGTIFLSTIGLDSQSVNPAPPPPLLAVGEEQVSVFRSTNNGAAFHDPVNGTPGFLANVDYMDKPWIAVDNFPGPGYGNVYLVADHAQQLVSGGPVTYDMPLTRSTDDGLTWVPNGGTLLTSSSEPGDFLGPNVTVGPDHAVYVSWWEYGKETWPFQPHIVMRKSVDQGVTFGDPVTVTALKTYYLNGDLFLTDSSGNYSFQSNALPQAAVNPVTGDIYVAYDDWGNAKGTDRGNVYFTESTDGGKKWSKPVQVNDDQTTNDQWFPALAVTPDGSHVGLFWYDRRLDPADNLIDRFGAIGTVSGHTVTFGANFRITDVSFPPAFGQDPVIKPTYMGDYDMAAADNNYFYTTWGDNRLADAFFANQPDVRFAKIPVGWAAAVSALAAPASPGSALASHPAVADSAPFVQPSGATATAATDPGTLLYRGASWKGLAVDAYFLDLARTSQTADSITQRDTGPAHAFGLAPPALLGATGPVVPPPARVSGTLTAALARRAAHRPAGDWGTDVLTPADPSGDGEAATWPAG